MTTNCHIHVDGVPLCGCVDDLLPEETQIELDAALRGLDGLACSYANRRHAMVAAMLINQALAAENIMTRVKVKAGGCPIYHTETQDHDL